MEILGPKRDEVKGEWRGLHNEELLWSVILTKYYLGDQIEKNDMGGAYSMYACQEGCVQGFGWEYLRERNHLDTIHKVGG